MIKGNKARTVNGSIRVKMPFSSFALTIIDSESAKRLQVFYRQFVKESRFGQVLNMWPKEPILKKKL